MAATHSPNEIQQLAAKLYAGTPEMVGLGSAVEAYLLRHDLDQDGAMTDKDRTAPPWLRVNIARASGSMQQAILQLVQAHDADRDGHLTEAELTRLGVGLQQVIRLYPHFPKQALEILTEIKLNTPERMVDDAAFASGFAFLLQEAMPGRVSEQALAAAGSLPFEVVVSTLMGDETQPGIGTALEDSYRSLDNNGDGRLDAADQSGDADYRDFDIDIAGVVTGLRGHVAQEFMAIYGRLQQFDPSIIDPALVGGKITTQALVDALGEALNHGLPAPTPSPENKER